MSKITIREIANPAGGPNASVSIDDQGEYPVSAHRYRAFHIIGRLTQLLFPEEARGSPCARAAARS